MKESTVKTVSGLIMLLSQLLILGSAVWLFFLDALLFDQLTTIIAITSPVFGVYVTAYINYVISRQRHNEVTITVIHKEYAILTISFCLIFSIVVLSLIWVKGLSLVALSFEQFKGLFAVAQVVIGSLASKLYLSQFPSHKSKK